MVYVMFQSDGSLDVLSFCGRQFPAPVRAAAFAAYCRVYIERTPWDSNASVLDGDDDADNVDATHEFASRRALELSERKQQWMCYLSRALMMLADDTCTRFQTLAVRALYDLQVLTRHSMYVVCRVVIVTVMCARLCAQWHNCTRNTRWNADKRGMLTDITVEELLRPSAYSEHPSTVSSLRPLLKSTVVVDILKHCSSHTMPHTSA